MNKACLIGRLTKDPELRYTGSNIAVTTFTLAVNRPFSGQSGEREADFIPVVVWRKQAENVKNYVKQGSQVAVEGRIQTRSYDDNEGKKRYVTEIIADSVQFLDSKSKSENQGGFQDQQSNPTPYDFPSDVSSTPVDLKNDPFADFGANIEIKEDELPF